jgi:CDP-glucose 4,6-dehydratase
MESVDLSPTNAFSGRRVLVTGHTGFKGAWLAVWLRVLGAKVVGYALDPSTTPNMFDMIGVADLVDDRRGDVRDADVIRRLVQQFDPEIVFHLAAQAIVRESYRDPVETYSTNVVGTASVLDACRRAPSLRAVVVVTSDKCYENRDWVWGYRENDALGGFDPYSSSKACAELVTDSFRRSYFGVQSPEVGIATARAGNVIGGGDFAIDRLVPDLARAAAAGTPALIREPHATRPWQHVLEPLEGYLQLAQCLLRDARHFSGSWNFGPPAVTIQRVESIVVKLAQLWQGKLQWSVDNKPKPHEAARLTLDSSKAAAGLDWHPRLGLDDTLRLAVEWYEACQRTGSNMRQVTESQIAYFQSLPAC